MNIQLPQIIKEFIFGKPQLKMEHEFFGKIVFMGGDGNADDDYWECEFEIDGDNDPLSILITADWQGPTPEQVTFCQNILLDQDKWFETCWPVFEPDFEQWTEKKFSGNWKDDFELMGFSIPKNADIKNEWDICYFVDSANHYFTARFENGVPKYNEIDG